MKRSKKKKQQQLENQNIYIIPLSQDEDATPIIIDKDNDENQPVLEVQE